MNCNYELFALEVLKTYFSDEPIEDILRKDGHRVQEKINKGIISCCVIPM